MQDKKFGIEENRDRHDVDWYPDRWPDYTIQEAFIAFV